MQIISWISRFSLVAVGGVSLVGLAAVPSYAGSFTGTYSFTNGSTAATTSGSPISFGNFSQNGILGTTVNLARTANDRYIGFDLTQNSTPDLTEYFQFSVNPFASSPTTFNSFGFNSRRIGGPTQWLLQASVGGGAFSNVGSGDFTNQTTSVAGLSAVTQQVVFRLYGYGASSPLNSWSVDDVVLSGITAVPTPAALPAMVGFGLGLWRKRKEQTA
jgi:hypothetical protein